MNKKLLICGAIAAGLLLTACVKKEAPKEDEQEQVEVVTTEQQQTVELQPVVRGAAYATPGLSLLPLLFSFSAFAYPPYTH